MLLSPPDPAISRSDRTVAVSGGVYKYLLDRAVGTSRSRYRPLHTLTGCSQVPVGPRVVLVLSLGRDLAATWRGVADPLVIVGLRDNLRCHQIGP